MLLRENIYDLLRADILACRLAPGDEMREQDLAERYEVSRQPVRDALLRLQREHLVTVQPRQGYRVTPISLSDARDLLRFRLALEPACVNGAIENGAKRCRPKSGRRSSSASFAARMPSALRLSARWLPGCLVCGVSHADIAKLSPRPGR